MQYNIEPLEVCREAGKLLENHEILQSVDFAQRQMSQRQRPVLALVATSSNALWQAWAMLTGGEIDFVPPGAHEFHQLVTYENYPDALHMPIPALKLCDVLVVFNMEGYASIDWLDVFTRADALLLCEPAFTMLTRGDKDFIETRVQSEFGYARLFFVMTGAEAISGEDDLRAVTDRLNMYAATLPGARVLDTPEKQMDLLCHEIPGQMETLRCLAVQQAVAYCCRSTLETLRGVREDASVDVASLKTLVENCDRRAEELRRHGRYTAIGVRNMIATDTKIDFQKSSARFASELGEEAVHALTTKTEGDLPTRVKRVEEYITNSWESFMTQQSQALELRFEGYMQDAFLQLQKDAEEVLVSLPEESAKMIDRIFYTYRQVEYPSMEGTKVEDDESDEHKRRMHGLSKVLMIGAVPVSLVAGPAMLIAMLGGALAIRKLVLPQMDSEQIQVVAQKLQAFCHEICRYLDDHSDAIFAEYGHKAEDAVLEAYDHAAQRLTDEVQAYQARVEAVNAQMDAVDSIVQRLQAFEENTITEK